MITICVESKEIIVLPRRVVELPITNIYIFVLKMFTIQNREKYRKRSIRTGSIQGRIDRHPLMVKISQMVDAMETRPKVSFTRQDIVSLFDSSRFFVRQ